MNLRKNWKKYLLLAAAAAATYYGGPAAGKAVLKYVPEIVNHAGGAPVEVRAPVAKPLPDFPWQKFAGGIMQEKDIKINSSFAGCPGPGREVVVWDIKRVNGEQWMIYGALDQNYRLLAVYYAPTTTGMPDGIYFGTSDRDDIRIARKEPYDKAKHSDGPCGYLFAVGS